MKSFSVFLSLILLCLATALSAQCVADAGPDHHLCNAFSGGDTITLGGKPAATGGVPPYTYHWQYLNDYPAFSVTADAFLSDTTVANPEYGAAGWSDTMSFVLTVKDANGQTCRDTVVLTESIFASHLGSYSITINEGDTVTFPVGPNVSSNFSIASVIWRPQHGMIDSTSLKPTVAPTRNINYYAVISDSMGCTLAGAPFVMLTVNPMNQVNFAPAGNVDLYPNPARDLVKLKLPQAGRQLQISISNLTGRVVDNFSTHGETEMTRQLKLPAGSYVLNAYDEKEVVATKKLIIAK